MAKNILKMLGERVLLQEVEEQLQGSILLPQSRTRAYSMGKVISVGSGIIKNVLGQTETKLMVVQVGDIVWFQINPAMAWANQVHIEGEQYCQLHQHDLLAKFPEPKLSAETIEMLGVWTLLEPFDDKAYDGVMVLPQIVAQNSTDRQLRYRLKKKGTLVTGLELGQEVIVDKMKANPIQLSEKDFFYLDASWIVGTVTPLIVA